MEARHWQWNTKYFVRVSKSNFFEFFQSSELGLTFSANQSATSDYQMKTVLSKIDITHIAIKFLASRSRQTIHKRQRFLKLFFIKSPSSCLQIFCWKANGFLYNPTLISMLDRHSIHIIYISLKYQHLDKVFPASFLNASNLKNELKFFWLPQMRRREVGMGTWKKTRSWKLLSEKVWKWKVSVGKSRTKLERIERTWKISSEVGKFWLKLKS